MIRQVQVSDVVRKFADLLDSERHREALAKVDPLGIKLAAMLDVLGQYAERCGIHLKVLNKIPDFRSDLIGALSQSLTDELRRFADMLERRHDKVREVDPGYVKLVNVLKAMSMYAKWLGADLGVAGGASAFSRGLIVQNPIKL